MLAIDLEEVEYDMKYLSIKILSDFSLSSLFFIKNSDLIIMYLNFDLFPQ